MAALLGMSKFLAQAESRLYQTISQPLQTSFCESLSELMKGMFSPVPEALCEGVLLYLGQALELQVDDSGFADWWVRKADRQIWPVYPAISKVTAKSLWVFCSSQSSGTQILLIDLCRVSQGLGCLSCHMFGSV